MVPQDFKVKKRQQISLQISDGQLGYGVINNLLIEGIQAPYHTKDLYNDEEKNKRINIKMNVR
jgi:hypothetical protein